MSRFSSSKSNLDHAHAFDLARGDLLSVSGLRRFRRDPWSHNGNDYIYDGTGSLNLDSSLDLEI